MSWGQMSGPGRVRDSVRRSTSAGPLGSLVYDGDAMEPTEAPPDARSVGRRGVDRARRRGLPVSRRPWRGDGGVSRRRRRVPNPTTPPTPRLKPPPPQTHLATASYRSTTHRASDIYTQSVSKQLEPRITPSWTSQKNDRRGHLKP